MEKFTLSLPPSPGPDVNLSLAARLLCIPKRVLCQLPTLFLHYWLINRTSSVLAVGKRGGEDGRRSRGKVLNVLNVTPPHAKTTRADMTAHPALVAINRYLNTNSPGNILWGD